MNEHLKDVKHPQRTLLCSLQVLRKLSIVYLRLLQLLQPANFLLLLFLTLTSPILLYCHHFEWLCCIV